MKRGVLDYDLIPFIPDPGAFWNAETMEPFEPVRNANFPQYMRIVAPTSIGLKARAALGANKKPVNAVQQKAKVFLEILPPPLAVPGPALGGMGRSASPQRSGAIRSPSPQKTYNYNNTSTPPRASASSPSLSNTYSSNPALLAPRPATTPSAPASASISASASSWAPTPTRSKTILHTNTNTNANDGNTEEPPPESYNQWKSNSEARKRARSMSAPSSPIDLRPSGVAFSGLRGGKPPVSGIGGKVGTNGSAGVMPPQRTSFLPDVRPEDGASSSRPPTPPPKSPVAATKSQGTGRRA